MSPRVLLLLSALVCFAGCTTNKSKEEKGRTLLSDLLHEAEDKSIALDKRLLVALKADSIALAQKDDTSHLRSQKLMATLYLKQRELKLSLSYFHTTAALAGRLRDSGTLAIALNNIGIIHNENQNYDTAIKYYRAANEIFRKQGDRYHMAEGYINLGIVYKNNNDYEKAYKISSAGAVILQEIDSLKALASAYTNIGNILKDLYRTDDALQYHFMALQILQNQNDSGGVAGSIHNAANVYRVKKDYKKALLFYDSALVMKRRLRQRRTEATTLDNMAEVYAELSMYRKAGTYFEQALKIRTEEKNVDGMLTTLNKLTRLYIMEGKLDKAEYTALRVDSLLSRKRYLRQRVDNARSLSEIYIRKGQYRLAAGYATLGLNLRDSLYTTSLIDTVLLLNEKNKTLQKEKELILSRRLHNIQHKEIRIQFIFILILALLLILLSVAAYLLLRSNKALSAAKRKIEILLREINHRVKNNLQIVSDMLQLQMRVTNDPVQSSLVQSGINRVESMNIIHTLLYREGYTGAIDMKKFIETLVDNLALSYKSRSDSFAISLAVGSVNISIDKAIPLGLIINELVTNIFKYAAAGHAPPAMEVTFTEKNNYCQLEISDNCKPWNLSKIKTVKDGLGLFLVEVLVKQLDGRWSFVSNDEGTTQSLAFHA